MLEVGNGMTATEDRAHFTMWAMLAAPLIAGNDLRSMSEETWAVAFLNRGNSAQAVTFDWSTENVGDDLSRRNANFDRTTYRVRDLWPARDAGTTAQPLAMTIPAHGAELYRLRRN